MACKIRRLLSLGSLAFSSLAVENEEVLSFLGPHLLPLKKLLMVLFILRFQVSNFTHEMHVAVPLLPPIK